MVLKTIVNSRPYNSLCETFPCMEGKDGRNNQPESAYLRWKVRPLSPLALEMRTSKREEKLIEVLKTIAIALLIIGVIGFCIAVTGTGIGTALYYY